MNIIDAVKSGLPFKRKKDAGAHWHLGERAELAASREDILATDWEVQEQTVTITKRELREAFDEAKHRNTPERVYEALEVELFK